MGWVLEIFNMFHRHFFCGGKNIFPLFCVVNGTLSNNTSMPFSFYCFSGMWRLSVVLLRTTTKVHNRHKNFSVIFK